MLSIHSNKNRISPRLLKAGKLTWLKIASQQYHFLRCYQISLNIDTLLKIENMKVKFCIFQFCFNIFVRVRNELHERPNERFTLSFAHIDSVTFNTWIN